MKRLIPLVFIAAFSSAFALDYPDREGRFIERSSEGWHFYEDPIEEIPEKSSPKPVSPKQEQVETLEVPEEQVKPSPPIASANKPADPPPMSAKWFRENLQKYQDLAWDNPTPENVATFYYLQSYMMDKSSMFADMAESVVVSNPALDESTRRPLATFAGQAVDRKAKENQHKLLTKLAKDFGLWFFFESTSPYTPKQAGVLKMLEREHQFTVLPISMDGLPPPENTFKSFRIDQGHAQKLGILSSPAVYLVNPKGEFALVGQGVMSRTDIHRRLLIAAQQHGWISEEEFKTAKPMLNPEYLIAERVNPLELQELHKNNSKLKNNEHGGGFIPPKEFMKYIKNKMSPNPTGAQR